MPDMVGSIQSNSNRSGGASVIRVFDPETLFFQVVAEQRDQRRFIFDNQDIGLVLVVHALPLVVVWT
jgi:hypothetical protein